MSGDPSACPRCGVFWSQHDEIRCADDSHSRLAEVTSERDAAILRAQQAEEVVGELAIELQSAMLDLHSARVQALDARGERDAALERVKALADERDGFAKQAAYLGKKFGDAFNEVSTLRARVLALEAERDALKAAVEFALEWIESTAGQVGTVKAMARIRALAAGKAAP